MKSIYFDLINMPHLIIGLFDPPELIYRWSIPRKNLKYTRSIKSPKYTNFRVLDQVATLFNTFKVTF